MIQVFDYFISHHNQKAFESVFGGVTCLPGCFSIYRIKARKDGGDDWVPVIVAPEITREYRQGTASTMHQKNLLLLGEDRFLTTLMLRTFPRRKMMFCPRARCKTEVPHTFRMLLSQRRRWINSTVHNLMELVLVRDLCGTFCLSMQFSVFMNLFGTASLPVAIALTYTLVIRACITPPKDFSDAIPLMLLAVVLGLPGVLIVLATRKLTYVGYMFVYLLALPVWNFILPVYSFWYFDDFSWGETRKVEGETKRDGHGDEAAAASVAKIPTRRWEEWERSRLRKLKRNAKRRAEFEAQFGQARASSDGCGRLSPLSLRHPRRHGNGTLIAMSISTLAASSVSSGEDDWRGTDIGAYDETQPPPLLAPHRSLSSQEAEAAGDIVPGHEIGAILDADGEWTDEETPSHPPSPIQPWQRELTFSPYPPPGTPLHAAAPSGPHPHAAGARAGTEVGYAPLQVPERHGSERFAGPTPAGLSQPCRHRHYDPGLASGYNGQRQPSSKQHMRNRSRGHT